ncbi:MAG: putative zinc-binding protein [Candidatus Moduliflexus flocculans]|nr:putative zinc-binding protein [Candidatus Moduliflexus flocculans]
MAGGEGERSFARYYPTIAVDGCDKRCAARATEKYSARPVGVYRRERRSAKAADSPGYRHAPAI